LSILEESAGPRRLTVWELYERVKDLDFSTGADAVRVIRGDRDSR
jgi:hypothetical protein